MARINPWDERYARPAPRQVTREFTDPALPDGETLSLTLREPDTFDKGLMYDKSAEFVALYIRGRGEQEPLKLVTPEGRAVPMSEYLLNNIAALMVMQVPEEGDPAYSLIEWVGIAARFPEAWREILAFSDEMYLAKVAEGNDAGAATGAN